MELSQLHQVCGEIFKSNLFEASDDGWLGRSNACKVYDTLVGDCFERQDCIGENFNQLLHRIADEWFDNYFPQNNTDYYFCNYILLLYLCVSRVDQIFDVINADGRAKLIRDYHQTKFPTLRQIRMWANFFKHPKEFLFTHWPRYYFVGSVPKLQPDDILIDTEFIQRHYVSEKDKRPTDLQNNDHVYVEIPNLEALTRSFCNEMNDFFEFICNNKLIADFLKQRSTIELIYESSDSEDAP